MRRQTIAIEAGPGPCLLCGPAMTVADLMQQLPPASAGGGAPCRAMAAGMREDAPSGAGGTRPARVKPQHRSKPMDLNTEGQRPRDRREASTRVAGCSCTQRQRAAAAIGPTRSTARSSPSGSLRRKWADRLSQLGGEGPCLFAIWAQRRLCLANASPPGLLSRPCGVPQPEPAKTFRQRTGWARRSTASPCILSTIAPADDRGRLIAKV